MHDLEDGAPAGNELLPYYRRFTRMNILTHAADQFHSR